MATVLQITPTAVRLAARKKFGLDLTTGELDKVMNELRKMITDNIHLILDSIKKGRA